MAVAQSFVGENYLSLTVVRLLSIRKLLRFTSYVVVAVTLAQYKLITGCEVSTIALHVGLTGTVTLPLKKATDRMSQVTVPGG